MGLKLKHPIVPSASPLSRTLDGIRKMEDAGAPAIVMYSLFEEQIEWESKVLDHYLSYGSESFAEATSYYPDLAHYNIGPEEYLNLIVKAKTATRIPIIASLNGVSTGGWIEYAHKIEEAGADALELNLYYIATDLLRTGSEIEQMYLDVVRDVKKTVTIPVAVKLSPFFSSTANMAYRLAAQGADALVLFNRFYQPDFDLEHLEVVPHLERAAAAIALDGDPAWARARGLRNHYRRASHRRCAERSDGRREGHDDGLRVVGTRSGPHQSGAGRREVVDDRTRVRLGDTDDRQFEPGEPGATGDDRARQLHEESAVVEPRPDQCHDVNRR